MVELQALDAQIYALNREKERIPLAIAELQKLFEEKQLTLNNLEEKSKVLLAKRKEKELDLASKEESLKKFNSQLFSLKTNKEYQAMLEQIAGLKADNSIIEEEILKVMEEQDQLKEELGKEKARLVEDEKKFLEEKKKAEEGIKEIDYKLGDLASKRFRACESIDKHILSHYEKILKGKDGLALVKVASSACQGCFINVTPQVINEIKMHDKVVNCEVCARILYIEEDL